MSLFQILECNDTLGTCCNDYGLVSALDVSRKVFNLFQIIVPIILIVFSSIQFIKLVVNPETKNGLKSVYNKYLAAAIVFFIPIIVNVVLGMMPETFEVAACWEQAKISAEVVRTQSNSYISPTDKTTSPILINSDEYKKGEAKTSDGSLTGTGEGSATGQAIVAYAKKFVGQQYVWGGTWNGELPYTGTDCSGFVQGVFKHFGINLTRTTYTQWADTSSYTLVTSGSIKAGDLVMYDGHVGILTGNGNEIVHAKGSKWGVVTDSDYKSCSSHAILGIMRINGVN
jgi:cell wall-associated NlpC family hydrolase